jgi:putative ABC transport system permease protein
MLLAGGFIEWVYWAMREDTIHSRLGHIQVARTGYATAGRSDPFAYLLPDSSKDLPTLEQRPGVETVAPRLIFSGLISAGDATISFIGEGVSQEKEGLLASQVLIAQGEALSPEDPEGIVLGEGLAANLGAQVGDKVVLIGTAASGSINAVEARVRGTFSTVTKAFDDVALRTPLSMAQQLLRASGAHLWVMLLSRTEDTDVTLAALRDQFKDSNLEFTPWHELADFYRKTVSLFSKQVGVMKLIVAVIILLGISNTLTMSVLERTNEIGTSMALGVSGAQVRRRFLLESVLIGAIGSALGLLLGLALAYAISVVGIPMPPPPGMARAVLGQIRLTQGLALDSVLVATFAALVAGLYPAWRASRLSIVDTLRHGR